MYGCEIDKEMFINSRYSLESILTMLFLGRVLIVLYICSTLARFKCIKAHCIVVYQPPFVSDFAIIDSGYVCVYSQVLKPYLQHLFTWCGRRAMTAGTARRTDGLDEACD